MAQETTEQRLSNLENEVAELKQKLAEQLAIVEEEQKAASRVDLALLRRVDAFGSELQRFERETKRSFEELRSDVKGVKVDVAHLQETIGVLVDAAKGHRTAIEELAAGQQQILKILLGEQRRND